MNLFSNRLHGRALRRGLAAACGLLVLVGATLFAAEPQTKMASPGAVRASQQGGVQPGPTLNSLEGSRGSATHRSVAGHRGSITLTQNVDPSTISAENSVACDNAGNNCTFEAAYARAFNLGQAPTAGQAYTLRRVVYGVQEALGTNPVTIAIYTDQDGGAPNIASLSLLASIEDVIPSGTQLARRTVDITAVLPANANLVVAVESPDLCATAGVNNNYFNGSNSAGESAPSYIKAAGCGIPDYASLAAIGFPNQHMVMSVELEPINFDDTDGDGVPNINDICPNNTQGLPVDSSGRPLRDCNLDCLYDAADIPCLVDEMLNQ